MIAIVGAVVVLAAVLLGFTMAGGHVGALIHPSELVVIGGSALGCADNHVPQTRARGCSQGDRAGAKRLTLR
jgi:flagellar motor component MotA